ncbi:hypothetical protein ACFL6U_15685 [Planctomycetota bacterium]
MKSKLKVGVCGIYVVTFTALTMGCATTVQKDLHFAYEHIGVAVQQKGTHVWGTSPVIGRDGKVHLLVALWPMPENRRKERFSGYFKTSEIAQYVGDSPEGPFEFVRMVVRDQDGTFNAPHNPTIQFIDDQYVLCFIVNSNEDRGTQRIIMYCADDLNGEWRPAEGAELFLTTSWTFVYDKSALLERVVG